MSTFGAEVKRRLCWIGKANEFAPIVFVNVALPYATAPHTCTDDADAVWCCGISHGSTTLW